MAVSYKRLWIKLAEKEMSRADLRKKAEIEPNTMTKLGKNEYVAMPIFCLLYTSPSPRDCS